MESFKGNSNSIKNKTAEPQEKNIKKVTDHVTVKKESELKKLKNQFFSEDAKTVKGLLFTSVFIPGVRKLISDIVKSGIDWIIFGFNGSSNQQNSGIRNVTYSNFYNRDRVASTTLQSNTSRPSIYSVNEIIFRDRGHAEETLLQLRDLIERYGSVTLADFYEMVSVKGSYTDAKYGWRDLSNAEVQRAGDGYFIRFPKIVVVSE